MTLQILEFFCSVLEILQNIIAVTVSVIQKFFT